VEITNLFLIFLYYIVTVYAKHIYCCWFKIAVTSKVLYYACIMLLHDVIGIHDLITLWNNL